MEDLCKKVVDKRVEIIERGLMKKLKYWGKKDEKREQEK